jgi:hypothetical protein
MSAVSNRSSLPGSERLLDALQDIEGIVRTTPIDRDAYTAREMRQKVLDRIAEVIAYWSPSDEGQS